MTVANTAKPLSRMAVPVTAKGRKNPPASYMNAPITGPMVRPKLKLESHQACNWKLGKPVNF